MLINNQKSIHKYKLSPLILIFQKASKMILTVKSYKNNSLKKLLILIENKEDILIFFKYEEN